MIQLSPESIASRHVGPRERRPQLPALDGLRFLAALLIYLFHIVQAHRADVMTFPALDQGMSPLVTFLSHGHVATGLFFVLSGFLLTYVYSNEKGLLKTTRLTFWAKRWINLYPIYFLSLLLIAPLPALLPIAKKSGGLGELLGGMTSSLTLTQSWFPSFSLFWNPPAWALSAMVTFYVLFPWLLSAVSRASARSLQLSLVFLSLTAVAPAVLFLLLDPEGDALQVTSTTLGGFWLTALRFHPIVWLSPFAAGVVLARLFVLETVSAASEKGSAWQKLMRIPPQRLSVTIDVEVTDPSKTVIGRTLTWFRQYVHRVDIVLVLLIFVLSTNLPIPYVLLRHGLLTPVYLLVVRDLAHGHGLASRIFAAPLLRKGSKASFALFALQMPVGVWFAYLVIRSRSGSLVSLLSMVAVTIAVSYFTAQFFNRWITPVLTRWILVPKPSLARIKTEVDCSMSFR